MRILRGPRSRVGALSSSRCEEQAESACCIRKWRRDGTYSVHPWESEVIRQGDELLLVLLRSHGLVDDAEDRLRDAKGLGEAFVIRVVGLRVAKDLRRPLRQRCGRKRRDYVPGGSAAGSE